MKNAPLRHTDKMRGITVLGLLFVVIVIILTSILAMNLVPPYLQFSEVKDSLSALAQDPATKQMTSEKIREYFLRRMQVNSISSIKPEDLVIEKREKKTWLVLNYETRVHVVANIDAVLKFHDEAMVE